MKKYVDKFYFDDVDEPIYIQDIEAKNDLIKLDESIASFLDVNFNKIKYSAILGDADVYYAVVDKEHHPILQYSNVAKTVNEFARESQSTISINAGIYHTEDGTPSGHVIMNHELVYQFNPTISSNESYLGMNDDGELVVLAGNSSTSELLESGVKWCQFGWYPIVEDGTYVGNIHDDTTSGHPRTWIAQYENGDYYVGVGGGRSASNVGLTLRDLYMLTLSASTSNIKTLFMLDGGASSNFVYEQIRMNDFTDFEDRKIPLAISFKKDEINNENLISTISNLDEKLNASIRYDFSNEAITVLNENVSILGQELYVKDSLATLQIQFTVSNNAIASYNDLFGNLPMADSNNRYCIACGMGGSAVQPITCYLSNDTTNNYGKIRTRQSLPTGNWFIYLSYRIQQ